MRLDNYFLDTSMEMIFRNMENSKTNESHEFALNVSLKNLRNLRNLNKQVARQNVSVYYNRKNNRQRYKNNKLKRLPPTWNGEFELPDGSYSVPGIQDYIEYIIKKKH